ncbi:hypothetical protein DSO57_1005843 [Entomophthora muscae]|uniref:Uncharacterized protein n=1 Tax=Entomophthora muscae TaxID=34485 RepID=A0ACC2UHI8_9FUNG|nr:hypothetical protein DSO57_1005843 [Entomophthora muscae]
MNHFIFTAVLTACLGIGGYQPGPATFGPSPEGPGQTYYKEPAQQNSKTVDPGPLWYHPLQFATHSCKGLQMADTIYPIVTAFTGFQFANLLPYLVLYQEREDISIKFPATAPSEGHNKLPSGGKESTSIGLVSLMSTIVTNQNPTPEENLGHRVAPRIFLLNRRVPLPFSNIQPMNTLPVPVPFCCPKIWASHLFEFPII